MHSKLSLGLKHILPNGIADKKEFRVGNVRGDKGRSLVVQLTGPKAGMWHDLAEKKGGDIFSLWAAAKGLNVKRDFKAVFSSMCEWLGVPDRPATVSSAQTSTTSTSNNAKSSGLGVLTGKWTYTDVDGNPIATVSRYDNETGKTFRPYDVKADLPQQPPEPRPLYNLPGIKTSQIVVIVEGEKAAQALIDTGICATTAMFGANTTLNKTDWSPLSGKDVLIWPDNDKAGREYAKTLSEKLKQDSVCSLAIVNVPKGKLDTWDAADAVAEGADINAILKEKKVIAPRFYSNHSLKHLVRDTSPMPLDIISPRILIPRSLLVVAGPPKSGKTDFLISLLGHMAAGRTFLRMTPPRPLKVAYLQVEIGYDYLRERTKRIDLPDDIIDAAGDNLFITSDDPIRFDKVGIDMARRMILHRFPNRDVDIIAVDPLRQVFDTVGGTKTENSNNDMLDFLQLKLEAVRDLVNPKASTALVHHTRKLNAQQLEGEEFLSLAGASSLHGHMSTGILIFRPEPGKTMRKLIFELRHGDLIAPMYIDKVKGKLCEVENGSALVHAEYGDKLNAERRRKQDVILQTLYAQAKRGHVYTMNQFCERFEDKSSLGSKDAIQSRLNILINTGCIKFFRNAEKYDLVRPARTKFGYMCTEGMELSMSAPTLFDKTVRKLEPVYPTHFKCGESGAFLPVENPKVWVYYNEKEEIICSL